MAAENARHHERQLSYEKGEFLEHKNTKICQKVFNKKCFEKVVLKYAALFCSKILTFV